MNELYDNQLKRLGKQHFLILYWSAQAEVQGAKYNITNVFDDLKNLGITRTKQSVMAYVESLTMLCFIDLKDQRNRKNIYITEYGADALKSLVNRDNFKTKKSRFLEVQK